MASILYGYIRSEKGIIIDLSRAKVVGLIYESYLSGLSLGGLIDMLREKQILSPSGNER